MSIKRIFAGVLLASGAVSLHAKEAPIDTQLPAELRSAISMAQAGRCPDALAIVRKQTHGSRFVSLAEDAQVQFYEVGWTCAAQTGDEGLALRYVREASRLPSSPAKAWLGRISLEVSADRIVDAVVTVEEMAKRNPGALGRVDPQVIHELNGRLKSTGDESTRARLLKVAAINYVPQDIGSNTDAFKRELTLLSLRSGDRTGAAAAFARIEDPKVLMLASVDPDLRQLIPTDFDARAAVVRHMQRMRDIAAARPEAIAPVIAVAEGHQMLGEGHKAIATLNTVHPNGSRGEVFARQPEERNWWWNSLAKSYARLGRVEEAMAAYRAGIMASENGAPNVSQVLNLAGNQLNFGQPAEALRTLASVPDNVNSRGRVVFHSIRGCASARAGAVEQAKEDVAYVTEHAADAPTLATEVLMCVGDLDKAAVSIIERLRDPTQQAAALLYLSDFSAPPAGWRTDPDRERIPQLRARPDVQAAIASAGGIRRFNIPD